MSHTVEYARQRLSAQQAGQTPCTGCEATCCTFLPLHDFQITRYQELDYALYLLNFDRIELAWLEGGAWRVHYRMPCGHLDLETRRCTVHNTAAQPHVCKRYDPYNCFYKRIFQSPDQAQYIRFDRGRLEALAAMLLFDGNRDLVGIPDREALLPHLPPLAPIDDPPAPADPLLARWEDAARRQQPLPGMTARRYQDFDAPCTGCAAWCCTRLVFPHGTPASVGNLDHLRFCMGFPGVEIGINESNEWSIVVRTACRHLVRDEQGAGRCSVFGQPERPRICTGYDASLCGYKLQFGRPRPDRFLRLRLPQFETMVGLFHFDEDGYVVHRPDYGEIRHAVEVAWATEGPRPTPAPAPT